MSWPIMFTVPGEPVAQGRPRVTTINGSPRMYDAPKSASYKGVVAMFAAQAMKGKLPMEGSVMIFIKVKKRIPTSWSNKKRAMALTGELRPTGRPDVDNYVKAILDGINGIVFLDDSQVTHLTVSKHYGDQPEVKVLVGPDINETEESLWHSRMYRASRI